MRKLLFAAVVCLTTVIPDGTARAQESAAPLPASAAAPVAAPAVTPHLIGGNTGIIIGGVSDSPYALGGIALDGGVIVGLGLSLGYPAQKTTDQVGFSAIVHGAYMIKNSANFAVGPELFFSIPFNPNPASELTFSPGVALWYAPFSVPILFGTAIDLDIKYLKTDGKVNFGLRTPGLRIGYAF